MMLRVALATTVLLAGLTPQALASTAYVTNTADGTVSPINTANNTAGTAITVGSSPEGLAITPDGRTAYVANNGSGTVSAIDTATETLTGTISVGGQPYGTAITPDGKTLYVTDEQHDQVIPIDLATSTADAPIAVQHDPRAIAITPDGSTAYVSNTGSDSVTPIDLAARSPGKAIAVGGAPYWPSITPDGRTLYVPIWSTATGAGTTVIPIDTVTNTTGAPIDVGSGPVAVAITADGHTAYAVNSNSDDVVPIDTAANAPGSPISVGSDPLGIAVTAGGKAYVADRGAGSGTTVTPFNAKTSTPGPAITVGKGPSWIAITPDHGPTASFTAMAAAPGRATRFNGGSSSASPGHTVGRYDWSFGDGTGAQNAGPAPAHIYKTAGTYTVTLTVTDNIGCSYRPVFTGQTVSCSPDRAAQERVKVIVGRGPKCRVNRHGARAHLVGGLLQLRVKCRQAARLLVSGRVHVPGRHGRSKARILRIRSVRLSVKAGKARILRIKLPGRAVAALRHGRREWIVLTLTAVGAHGVRKTTIRIQRLELASS